MSSAPVVRTFEVRHLQLARAALAAIAAALVTFSPDHSADVGLSVFSGFAISTGLIFFLAAWLVAPAGRRMPSILLGVVAMLTGMIGSVLPLRSVTLFFTLVILWALASGLIEVIDGARARRSSGTLEARSDARDQVTVGILTLVLSVALMFVPAGYALKYYIADAGQSFTLTGITIAVGLFGGYAAIVAVYLGIAGFSPRRHAVDSAATERSEGAA